MDISNFEERRILLKMRTKEAAGFLYLENRTAHNVEILDNKIVISKTTSIEHGYGLKNVTAILDNIGALYVLIIVHRSNFSPFLHNSQSVVS